MSTAPAPALNSRVIGLAHHAARAVLEHVLVGYGLTFQQSVTLRLAAIADGPVERDALVGQVVDSLKVDEADIRAVVEELVAAKLVAPDPERPSRLTVTEAGLEAHTGSTAATAPLSARIYADIPTEDLAVAGRVLTLITERANAELTATK
ncbi:winged helix DNA-binding protein [Streptomyces phaeolivaceus]|uniref:Winged helix DNA-binding protein n=2 Tax=Streptomyces phaeolivaceus TaxID=2653200 RepID=A0A5P8KJU6_9ACTN|nr:winged helix DNA-binding protein [Streptomyces phaeolivaceus]